MVDRSYPHHSGTVFEGTSFGTSRNRSHEESRANSCVHWPSIVSDIEEIVRKCRQCQEAAKQPQKQPLQPWPTTTQVFERVHIDLAGPCSDSNSYLVIVDSFSRWPEVFMLRHTSSQYVIEQLQWLFDWFGIPKTLVSDNGPQFTSSHFKDFCDSNGFVTSFHHHTTHNQTEQPKNKKHGAKRVKFNIGDKVQLVNYRDGKTLWLFGEVVSKKAFVPHKSQRELSLALQMPCDSHKYWALIKHGQILMKSPRRTNNRSRTMSEMSHQLHQPEEITINWNRTKNKNGTNSKHQCFGDHKEFQNVRFLSPGMTGQRHNIRQ
ncbi:hypothetical protein niasHT_003359 [Heterodera trifolii]|uniref:Integrase catalytic domain-containing protein n=1 Tax=Heterodera trifolii TaxID=157864 RepID=A0ABD2M321_9BILA